MKATQEQRKEFSELYALYKQYHKDSYARRIAWGIVFEDMPF